MEEKLKFLIVSETAMNYAYKKCIFFKMMHIISIDVKIELLPTLKIEDNKIFFYSVFIQSDTYMN